MFNGGDILRPFVFLFLLVFQLSFAVPSHLLASLKKAVILYATKKVCTCLCICLFCSLLVALLYLVFSLILLCHED